MTTLCFTDCETTSLRPDRRAWEVGIVARRMVRTAHPDGPDTYEPADAEHHWFVDADQLDLGNADLFSLNIGHFHDRHPQYRLDEETDFNAVTDEIEVMSQIEAVTRGAILLGAVVNFDAETIAARMRAHGICPAWHYHLCDIEGYIAGKLGLQPPWKSDDLSAAVGVNPLDFDRHTALGDALWVRAQWDAVTTGSAR